MNNFVKFPLILAIVGVICAGALSIVYEITSGEINGRIEAEAIALMKEIVPDIKSAPSVISKYETEDKKLNKIGVTNLYEAKDANDDIIGYGYLASVTAYQPDLKFIVVLDDVDSIIKGFKVISHKETGSGTFGGPLLDSPDFAAQFTNLAFDDLSSGVDFVAGSTAKITLNAVKNGVDKIISFHKEAFFGEAGSSIDLTTDELNKLDLPEGYVLEDKTEDFKTQLKANVSANKYEKTMESLGLINFIEIKDANGVVKGHAYAVEGKYNCEVEHGNRAWQSYKIALVFDENGANTKLVVISSGDSLSEANQLPLDQQPWVAENFNGKTIEELNDALSNDEIDYVHGATFTTNAIKAHVATIVSAHLGAYGN